MLRIVVIVYALVISLNPVMAEKSAAKKGHSFEECQKRARADGNMWMGTNGGTSRIPPVRLQKVSWLSA